jgi:hypothetical protein
VIRSVLFRFEEVIAHTTPSLVQYVDQLVAPVSFNFAAAVTGYYRAAGRPWESYIDDELTRAGVDPGKVLDIASRTRTALSRPEAWRLYEDVPLALDWMAKREIPTTIVSDWPVDVGSVLSHARVHSNAVFVYREGAFSDVVAHEASRLGFSASEMLYVAADVESDFEDARAAGCYPLVIDRQDRFDESVPNVNHLVEIELHI